MSVLWTSDLHVKPASVYRKNLLKDDAFIAVDQIEEIAVRNSVRAVILGGDVFDSNSPCGESIYRIFNFINKMHQQNTLVYYIEGNHDRVNKNPHLSDRYYDEHRLLSSLGALPLGQRKVEIDGMTYYGIDYCPVAKLHERLAQVPECDVLCLHTGFRHLIGFEGAYDMTKEQVPENVKKLVLVGHVHVHDETMTKRGVKIASCGSPWVWRVSECDAEHGVFLVHEHATLAHWKLETRKYFDVTEVQDIKDTIAENHLLPPVVHYDPEVLGNLDPSEFEGVILVPKAAEDIEDARDLTEFAAASLNDALPIAVPKKDYPDAHEFMKGLLDTSDPKGYTREFLRQCGASLKEAI